MSNPRSPPFPVINPQPGFWESVDNMTPSERMTSLFASFAGAAIGIYAGRMLKHKALSPLTMGVTLGLTGATVGMFKGAIGGYERLKGYANNGLPAVHPEFQRFPVAPRAAIETLHHLDKYRK